MRILRKQDIENIIFFDIETAPLVEELEIDSPLWNSWEYYCIKNKIEDVAGSYFEMAGLHAEYAKIVCISVGIVRDGAIRIKTYSGDEKELLEEFNDLLAQVVTNKTFLCGHVIKMFDCPFVMKRMLSYRILPHLILDVAHLKPWETSFLDTADLWKGTGYKASSLVSITTTLGLDSPKEEITGKEVGRAYYDGRLPEIIEYCERDVEAVVNIVRALRGEVPLERAEDQRPPEPKGVLTYLFDGGQYTDEVKKILKESLKVMNAEDKKRAFEILNTIPTKAKGKTTFITKKDIKELQNG